VAALSNLTFDQWLDHAFGPAARAHGNPWYFDPDANWWAPDPATAVAFFTRLFEAPARLADAYADRQIGQGFTYLLDTGARGDDGWFSSRTVPAEARERCIRAIFPLFAGLFAPRCAPQLGHLDHLGEHPLNTMVYMFWDVFPAVALPDDPDHDRLNRATLDVMASILTLTNPACVESALHGLGHAHARFPAAVEHIVDAWLAAAPSMDDDLRAYAASARCGCVL